MNNTNRYRNPWHEETLARRPEFYENNAPQVFEYRGVKVFKLNDRHFDYVLAGTCITQRAGFDKDKAGLVIDGLLDGEQPTCKPVADHISLSGGKGYTYDQYTADYQKGLRE